MKYKLCHFIYDDICELLVVVVAFDVGCCAVECLLIFFCCPMKQKKKKIHFDVLRWLNTVVVMT